MKWILNDLRVWAAAFAACVVVASSVMLDWLWADSLPLEDQFLASTATPLESLPSDLSGLLGGASVQELQAASRDADRVPNPYAGVPLEEVRPGVSLPEGMLADLARATGRASTEDAVEHVLGTAWKGVYDPEGEIEAVPGLEAALTAEMEASFWDELVTWGALLRAAPAWGPRPWAPVAGLGQAAIGGSVGPELEGAIYETWVDLLAREATREGRVVRTFRLGFPVGTWKPASATIRVAFGVTESWYPDYVDMDAALRAWTQSTETGGPAPEADPFGPLGRLRAIQLLAEADRVTLVFGGHGQEVREVGKGPARFADYAIDGLSVGEECQELALLRSGRGDLTVRYGFCLDDDDTLVALSCSNAWADRSGPQHNTASLAWLITHGSPAPFEVVEPVGFRIFTPLQEGLRAAEDETEVEEAVRTALSSAGELIPLEEGLLTDAMDLGEDVWFLRTADATVADLVVVGPEVREVAELQDRRLQLVSTAWSKVASSSQTQGAAQIREPMRICGGRVDCDRRLDHLSANLAGTWPTSPTEAVPIGLAGRKHLLMANPNLTHTWVRLHVVPAAGESEADWLTRADGVLRSVGTRRVVGVTGWAG